MQVIKQNSSRSVQKRFGELDIGSAFEIEDKTNTVAVFTAD
jgi:hypothetical protein